MKVWGVSRCSPNGLFISLRALGTQCQALVPGSGCAKILQLPDIALLLGAFMSLDLLRVRGIPASPVHLSMEGLHPAVLGSLGLASTGIGSGGLVLPPSKDSGCCVGCSPAQRCAHALVWGKTAATRIGQGCGMSRRNATLVLRGMFQFCFLGI